MGIPKNKAKRKLVNTVQKYQDKSLLSRVIRKISYYKKQNEIRNLILTNNTKQCHIKMATGDKIEIVLPDNISSSIYLVGFFEAEETLAFSELMKPGYQFLDIGAHIGYYSILAKSLGGENTIVHSFEPTPSTFDILKRNMQSKGGCELHNIALFSSQGSIEFNDYGIRYMCLNSFKNARLEEKIEGNKIQVPCDTLDNIVAKYGLSPDVIKIDAESAELDILNGAQNLLKNHNPVLFLEVGDYELSGMDNSIKIIEYLMNYGYKVYEYTHKFIPHTIQNTAYPSMSLYFSKTDLT